MAVQAVRLGKAGAIPRRWAEVLRGIHVGVVAVECHVSAGLAQPLVSELVTTGILVVSIKAFAIAVEFTGAAAGMASTATTDPVESRQIDFGFVRILLAGQTP